MIGLDALSFVGNGLVRPECVIWHPDGLLVVPDWTPPGGVTLIDAASVRCHRLLAKLPDAGVDLPVRANGIAFEADGSLLLAHLGDLRGGIYRLSSDGRCSVVCATVDGALLPPANFVTSGPDGRIWLTVSTRKIPRAEDYRADAASGFIAVVDDASGDARIVADGLGYTNECCFSPDGGTLYVNETFAQRLSAFEVHDGGLRGRRTVTVFGPGDFPDGVAATADGGLVVTCIVSNRVIHVAADGTQTVWIDGSVPGDVAAAVTAFNSGALLSQHLQAARGATLAMTSSLAFGGADLSTGYLGTLGGTAVPAFTAPVAGAALRHHAADARPLLDTVRETIA
ncbi:MAG: SMP-30/gluconolactonase/LRE family protein [Pseudomonadota bacterium]